MGGESLKVGNECLKRKSKGLDNLIQDIELYTLSVKSSQIYQPDKTFHVSQNRVGKEIGKG